MKEPVMTRDEKADFIVRMSKPNHGGTDKDWKLYHKLINEEYDIVESLIRDGKMRFDGAWPESWNCERLLCILNKAGRGKEIAMEKAELVVDKHTYQPHEVRMEYYGHDWTDADEEHLKNWLLCKCDDLPESIPVTDFYPAYFGGINDEESLAAMSYVTDYPIRFTAYKFWRGAIFEFKYPMRALMVYREEGFGNKVLEDIKAMSLGVFRKTKEELEVQMMKMFSAIYCSGERTKKETLFYQKFIDEWMTNDKEHFINCLSTELIGDLRKKVLKKLTGSAK